MNKIIFSLCCFYLIFNSFALNAEAANTAEFRVAAFFHQDQKFRTIYGNANTDFQILGSLAINPYYELWSEIDYMSSSKNKECYHSKIQLVNGSLGIRYLYSFSTHFDGYLGIGPSAAYTKLKNHSCCNRETKSVLAWGCLSKIGVRYWFLDTLFLDVFADYLYQNAHFRKNVQVGGFKTGVGIGLSF